MKVLHLSDWHAGYLDTLKILQNEGLDHVDEDVELVAITGDMLPNFRPMFVEGFEEEQARRQRGMWCQIAAHFQELWPNADIIAVPGNHDWCDYGIPGAVKSIDRLGTETFMIRGLKVSGFRGVPMFNGMWHGELNDRVIDILIEQLDPWADIYITHTPPYRILDSPNGSISNDPELIPYVRNVGAIGLAEFLWNNPSVTRKYHLFGHIHEQGGEILTKNGVFFSNAAGTCNILEIK